jgi:hypothetical protein
MDPPRQTSAFIGIAHKAAATIVVADEKKPINVPLELRPFRRGSGDATPGAGYDRPHPNWTGAYQMKQPDQLPSLSNYATIIPVRW